MEMLTSALNWLFIKTIYGIAGIAVVIYVIMSALKKTIPKLPDPVFIAIPVFLIGLFTVPSIPRYRFEDDVMSKIEGKDWIRVVNKRKIGPLTEPLTLIKTPVGSVTIIIPNSPVEGGYREVVMRYKEEPIVSMVEPYCNDFTIIYAQPSKGGVFRYLTKYPNKMNDEERKWYCDYDWSKEKEALRRETLRQMKESTNEQQ